MPHNVQLLKQQNIMDNLKDLEKAISKLQKLKDDGVIPLFADGMLKAYNDLLPLVKKLTTPVVVCSADLEYYGHNFMVTDE